MPGEGMGGGRGTFSGVTKFSLKKRKKKKKAMNGRIRKRNSSKKRNNTKRKRAICSKYRCTVLHKNQLKKMNTPSIQVF